MKYALGHTFNSVVEETPQNNREGEKRNRILQDHLSTKTPIKETSVSWVPTDPIIDISQAKRKAKFRQRTSTRH